MILSAGGFAVYLDETHIFSLFAPYCGSLHVRANREKLAELWLQSFYFRLTGLDPHRLRDRMVEECCSAGDFLRLNMESILQMQGVERWAEHTPEHVLYLRDIKRTIPEALIIHVIRDGRDVALSLNKQGWVRPLPGDAQRNLLVCGIYWEWMVRAGRKIGCTLGPDYMEIRYEDLVAEPRSVLARIGHFIQHDLDYDRIMRVALGVTRRPNTSFPVNSCKCSFAPVGRWRSAFCPERLAQFEQLVGPYLKELGYESGPSTDAKLGSLGLRRLRSQYLSYFSFRFWLKSHLAVTRYLPRNRVIRASRGELFS